MENIPLAERLRPKSLDDFLGQTHLVGANGIIRKVLSTGFLPSMIFWGPPGVGKTTLAQVIASQANYNYFSLSAISAGVKEVREIIDKAKFQGKTLVFIDEIHRFNKSQQDALLGAIEKGVITLIGATTENPSFEVNAALLSRCQVYTLYNHTPDELKSLVDKALHSDKVLQTKSISVESYEALLRLSGGDARKLLNLLEITVQHAVDQEKIIITDDLVTEATHQRLALYDKNGEMHYDLVSAFIKSIRGSDPNAAIYYLARMIEGGEDVSFIARRLVILASEDIGNANPTALVIATSCFQAVNVIGYPEAEIILAQAVTYLASSAKSNASYVSIKSAKRKVKETGDLPVPLHLRNAPTKLMKTMGYGSGYQYAHDFDQNFVHQEFLPSEISGTVFYEPGKNPREDELRKHLKSLWKTKYGY